MSASELREKLHQYIDDADETSLTEIYKMISEDDLPFNYSVEDIEMLYKRRDSYLSGEGKNFTVEESLNKIRK